MNKRTVAVFVISIVMVFSLSACGIRSNETTTKVLSDDTPTSASVVNTTTTTPSDTAPTTSSDTNTATITPISTATNSGSSEKNIDDLDNILSQDKGAEWKAYRSILLGDFSLIEDSDYKSEMEFLYTAATRNGKCGWKYILMDFNKDGVNDLFIQLDSEHNSAFFSYSDGKVKGISIDDLEATCYLQPLKGGMLLEIYDYWIAPTKSVYELDSEFMPVNLIHYISMTVDDYKDFKESFGAIMDEFSTIKKEGVYYFQEIDGMKTSLSAEKWEQIQMDIEGQLIPDNEWRDCSELSAN